MSAAPTSFKSSDYRISPFELESILLEHEAVAEAAVVPCPDPIRLAIPKAYVLLVSGVARSPATAMSIFEHLHTRLAPFKRIRRIELVTELPKTIWKNPPRALAPAGARERPQRSVARR